MDFGSLQSVTAWRLTRSGVRCDAIVFQGPEAFRLVVVEGQQIVEWTKFVRAAAVRQQLRTFLKTRRRAGWLDLTGPARRSRSPVSTSQPRALLRIAEGDGKG